MATFQNNEKTGPTDWIPLVDYAHKKGTSLSTLRRHIKAGKIPYKVEEGRYLLFDDSPNTKVVSSQGTGATSALGSSSVSDEKYSLLVKELKRAREEIAELKTLIAFYEERTHHQRPEV